MAFRVGQKVVCVDARAARTSVSLHKGMVYTVRACGPERFAEGCWVLLVEIINPPSHWRGGFEECGYAAERFRPIVEKKTDIAIFQEILRKVTRKNKERA